MTHTAGTDPHEYVTVTSTNHDTITVASGLDLLTLARSFTKHPHNRDCPTCGDPVTTVAVVRLVYVFEPCSCESAEFEHLVERLYHRACYEPIICNEFRPFRVRGTARAPTHYTVECYECGRTERNHQRG